MVLKNNSLSFLNQGSSQDFINALKAEAMNHPAVKHDYLTSLRDGKFNNMNEVIKDYAHQYSHYSSYFVRYLNGSIRSLKNPQHKESLRKNVIEEVGDKNSIDLAKKPHVEIFNHFKQTIGIDAIYEKNHPPSTTTLLWRDLFLQKCNSNISGVSIGAIGLATEYIVPTLYSFIKTAIEKHTDFPESATLFFKLHIECDDGHAETLNQVAEDIAEDLFNREAIRFGVISALNLRNTFWDSQYARALKVG